MTSSDLKTKIRDYLFANFIYDPDFTLADSASLMESGVIDSTGVLELILFLESSFGVTVQDDELVPENLDSVDNIAGFLTSKMEGRLRAAS